MNQGLKQRLAGVLVLVCLAIIFIPMLLDGGGLDAPEFHIDVPRAPQTPAIPRIAPRMPLAEQQAPQQAVDAMDDAVEQALPTADDATLTARAAGVSSVGTAAAVNSTGLPQAWSVRLGSFGDPDNAAALVQRLLEAGHKAYSRAQRRDNTELTLVYVGPVMQRSEAQALRERLAEEVDLEGMIVEFSID